MCNSKITVEYTKDLRSLNYGPLVLINGGPRAPVVQGSIDTIIQDSRSVGQSAPGQSDDGFFSRKFHQNSEFVR